MTRRRLLAGLGLAPLAAAPRPAQGDPQQAVWDVERCPGCGRDVCFLPAQRRNRCAWCGRVVRHAVG
jgi:hypothetical protein